MTIAPSTNLFLYRYYHFWYPIVAIIVSLITLVLTSTVRLPKFVRKRWGSSRRSYSALLTDIIPIDGDSDDENLDPIYRLRTADAGADYDDVSVVHHSQHTAAEYRDVEDEALDIAPRTSVVAHDERPVTFVLNATPARRFRTVLELVVTLVLVVIHWLSLLGIILVQYPSPRDERAQLVKDCSASSLVAVSIFLFLSLIKSERLIICYRAIFYIWLISACRPKFGTTRLSYGSIPLCCTCFCGL